MNNTDYEYWQNLGNVGSTVDVNPDSQGCLHPCATNFIDVNNTGFREYLIGSYSMFNCGLPYMASTLPMLYRYFYSV